MRDMGDCGALRPQPLSWGFLFWSLTEATTGVYFSGCLQNALACFIPEGCSRSSQLPTDMARGPGAIPELKGAAQVDSRLGQGVGMPQNRG